MPVGGKKNEWILMVVEERPRDIKNMLKAYSKERKKVRIYTLYSFTLLFLKFEDCSGLESLKALFNVEGEREADGGERDGATKRR